MKTTRLGWTRLAPLLALTAILAGCGPAVTPKSAPVADSLPPAPAPTPNPAETFGSCDDSAIRLLDRGAGIHGAIVADTLHMGGATAPATCSAPVNQIAGRHPDDRTEQAQQSQYYLIVIRYPGGNRLYVISRRADGTSCIVDTNDRCIAQVTGLPDGFDLDDLPDDVAPTIPAGRPAPPTVSPPPGGGYTPPVVPAPPAASAPAAAGNPQPRDGATGVAVETLLLSWSAAARAASYDVYWGTGRNLAADAGLGTPIGTTFTATTIRRPALGTTYYWRVDAKNDQGTTRGSVWSFTTADRAAPPPPGGGGYTPPAVSPPPADETSTIKPAAVPLIESPLDGATGVTVKEPRLRWDGPGDNYWKSWKTDNYELYWGTSENLAADADLGTPIVFYHSASVCRWPTHPLRPRLCRMGAGIHSHRLGYLLRRPGETHRERLLAAETTYYWRVDAMNDAGTTEGDVWSFTTGGAPVVVVSFTKDNYRFAEEGENLTETTYGCPLHHQSICKFAHTTYSIPMEWDGPITGAWVTSWESEGTAEKQGYIGSNPERKDFYPLGINFRVRHTLKGGPWNLEIQIVQDDKKEEDEQYRVHIEPDELQDPETGLWHSIDSDIVCGRCSATITIVDND